MYLGQGQVRAHDLHLDVVRVTTLEEVRDLGVSDRALHSSPFDVPPAVPCHAQVQISAMALRALVVHKRDEGVSTVDAANRVVSVGGRLPNRGCYLDAHPTRARHAEGVLGLVDGHRDQTLGGHECWCVGPI